MYQAEPSYMSVFVAPFANVNEVAVPVAAIRVASLQVPAGAVGGEPVSGRADAGEGRDAPSPANFTFTVIEPVAFAFVIVQ